MKKAVLFSSLALILGAAGTGLSLGLFTPQATPGSGSGDLLRTLSPFRSYRHAYDSANIEAMRPRFMGRRGVVSTGHYLATMAGMDMLKRGGNAFDAGVTAAMALKVTKMDYAGWTGVAPLILYSAAEGRVVTRVGAGTSPARATLEYFQENGKDPVNTALVPADIDVWLAALDRYGTIGFTQAAGPALEIAEEGYHLYKMQKWMIGDQAEGVLRFPYNRDFWFQHGVGEHEVGDVMVNADLGRLIRYMMGAEERALASGATRSEGIRAARDAFYKGEPARAVDALFRELGGIVTYDDLAGYEGKWMDPLKTKLQSLLQVFLNVVVWGMSPEQALDQPRFGSYNFPTTGNEINRNPAGLLLEDRIPAKTAEALKELGHDVRWWGLWNLRSGAPTIAYRDPETGVMIAAGDVRRETSSLAW